MMCFLCRGIYILKGFALGPALFCWGGGQLLRKKELPSEVIFIHGGFMLNSV